MKKKTDQEYNVEWVPIDSIKLADYNPRSITAEAFNGLVESIKKWGMPQPIIANPKNNVIQGGHQRWRAAKKLEWVKVPVVWKEVASHAEEVALNLTLNNKHISGTFTDQVDESIEIARQAFDPETFELLRLDDLSVPDYWQQDDGQVDNEESNLDGIAGVIKVVCPQERKTEVIAAIGAALAGYDGITIK